jgi:hypothetical protein
MSRILQVPAFPLVVRGNWKPKQEKTVLKILTAGALLFMTHAALACSNRTLDGSYSFTVHGQSLSADGKTSTGLFDGVGLISFDGDGNLTQEDYIINNGIQVPGIAPNASGFHTGETGTYAVNSDCTGSIVLTLGPGNTRSDAIVITKRGAAIHAIVSGATEGDTVLLQTYADYEKLDAK